MKLFCALCIQIQIFLCVHKSWGASLVSLEHSYAHIIISFFLVDHRIFGLVGSIDIHWLLASIGIFWLLVSLFVMSLWHIILLQSLGLNIVCLPPSIYCWICVLHSTLLWRNTQFMEKHDLYCPSKLFSHFGNWCQWGRSFRVLWRSLESHLFLLWFCS